MIRRILLALIAFLSVAGCASHIKQTSRAGWEPWWSIDPVHRVEI